MCQIAAVTEDGQGNWSAVATTMYSSTPSPSVTPSAAPSVSASRSAKPEALVRQEAMNRIISGISFSMSAVVLLAILVFFIVAHRKAAAAEAAKNPKPAPASETEVVGVSGSGQVESSNGSSIPRGASSAVSVTDMYLYFGPI
jgi:hypothetical protein